MVKKLNTDFTSKNCSFESVNLIKNSNPDKFKYSGYDIGFDSRSEFLFTDGSMGKMSLLPESICTHLCILIIKIKIS